MDRLGAGPQGPQPLTARRTLGALLAVPAVVIAVAGRFGGGGLLWLAVLPVLGGIGVAWQQAVNGRVRVATDSAFVAALVNFIVSTTVLVVVTAVLLPLRGWPVLASVPWWYYGGGVLGILVIATAAAAVRLVGVLLVGLCSVAGQLAGALLLEVLLPGHTSGSPLLPVLGTVLAMLAVASAGTAGLPRRTASDRMAAGTERGAR